MRKKEIIQWRCRYSELGKRRLCIHNPQNKDREGVAWSRRDEMLNVKWDGLKSVRIIYPSFIEPVTEE